MKELHLSNGAVLRYRPVPPYAVAQAFQALEDPPPPKDQIESIAGHTEETLAAEDSQAYQDWLAESLRVKRLRAQRIQEMALEYGIVSWQLPLPDGARGFLLRVSRLLGLTGWRAEPPKDWKIPETLHRYGVGEYISNRLTYVYVELITTRDDLNTITDAILNASTSGELSDEEVQAAEASFRPAVGRGEVAGPAVPSDNRDGIDAGRDKRGEEVGAQEAANVV